MKISVSAQGKSDWLLVKSPLMDGADEHCGGSLSLLRRLRHNNESIDF